MESATRDWHLQCDRRISGEEGVCVQAEGVWRQWIFQWGVSTTSETDLPDPSAFILQNVQMGMCMHAHMWMDVQYVCLLFA